jgi:TonB-dependent receptor
MKKVRKEMIKLPPLVVMAGALSTWHPAALAQQQPQDASGAAAAPATPAAAPVAEGPTETVVVEGRSLSASEELVQERLDDPSVVDTIGAEAISRLGDSTVAASLRRMPGLSLVSDKFIYIRGLGERYSATSVNGAEIPSPDLTRNVIPLDIFPSSAVESIRVQKAWSADLPANFGGGSVNVRTRGIPDDFELNFEVSTGTNSESSGDALSYPGGDDDALGEDDGTRALPAAITAALNEYQGDVGVQNILTFLRRANPEEPATLADAQAVNRSLGLALNRNMGIENESINPDLGLKASVGHALPLGANSQIGFLVGGTYDNAWRESTRVTRNFTFPTERTDTLNESTHSVNISGTADIGLKIGYDHELEVSSLFLRNTDDETGVRDFFNVNRQVSDGLGFRDYRFRYEEREMLTTQVRGTHVIGEETREWSPLINALFKWAPVDTQIAWFYSESKATTDIPNELTVSSNTVTDRTTGEVLSEAVQTQSTAADYRYTDLEDRVEDYGWSFSLPFEFDVSKLELKGGSRHSQKARTYKQSQFSLGPITVSSPTELVGPLDQVFSDENILDPANNFVFARQGTNNQSYIAATMTEAVYGVAEWTYDETWRLSGGLRYEDYRQVAVDWNPYGYSQSDPQVSTDRATLERGTFDEGELYPAASVTYMSDWLAETFQLRFGWSQTTIRPDLREVTDASYIDPLTDILTRGNSGVVPADVTNYDVRAEWRFASGDSFTITLFDKEIDQPIEFFETAASDTTIAREILNADSAFVRGVELEGLKQLDFLGDIGQLFFVQGNVTIQESELEVGPRASAPTNPVRELAGASEYVANVMLGFDSPAGRHSASLIYNVFGERLFVAGRNGAPDAFEQPFNSLDLNYTWYPTDALTVKLKAQNVLDETIEIERQGVVVFEEKPGATFSLSAAYRF